MIDGCLAIEELESLLSARAEDPRLRHLLGCPRCRVLWASYRQFLKPPPEAGSAVSASQMAAARQRLSDRIRRETGAAPATADPSGDGRPGRNTEDPARTTSLGQRHPRTRGAATKGIQTWWQGFRRPLWRPVLALSGCVILGVTTAQFASRIDLPSSPGKRTALRGSHPADAPDGRAGIPASAFEPMSAILSPGEAGSGSQGGGLELRWSPIPGAETYRVIIHGPDLGERARWDVREARLALEPPAADRALANRRGCLWRVIALREGEEVAQSPLQLF